ncbi:right-handed parallel beta-helix repeat-containing protein [Frankia nepalensis]|uniref:right-handed parallel beta-helix repeat-containing protein n=1 Tax=Frankia nepalensis TaxID=1836974 RepID=UPI00288AAF4B|nr:right-handed parallel beta-helix repeat-containing protein [Frankia nepalensis]
MNERGDSRGARPGQEAGHPREAGHQQRAGRGEGPATEPTLVVSVDVPAQRTGQPGEAGGGRAGSGGARRAARAAARATASGARGRGVYSLLALMTLLTAVVLSVTVGRDYQPLRSTTQPFHRHSQDPSFDPISNVLRGLPPNTINNQSSTPDQAIRAMAVSQAEIALLAGGRLIRTIPLATPATGLPELAAAVGDPSWLEYDGGGQVTVRAALVVVGGAALGIAAPVRDVVLESRRGVLLGADGAALALDGVHVRPSSAHPDPDWRAVDQNQPFVFANNDATLVISNSHLSHIGRDWNSSYGISWADGSTGSITNSEVDNTFIGVYTDKARDITVANNWFHDNTLYGIDPHSGSTGIVVRQNLSERNGRHGIIFSEDVTGSLVENNITRNNHLNGIMMDAGSTGNRIVGNTATGNRGDGIVLASSPDNVLERNIVTHNRVGIHVHGDGGTEGITIRDNHVAGNQLASQGIALAGNDVIDNGDQWRPRVLAVIWSLVPITVVLLVSGTAVLRRRRGRSGSRRTRVTAVGARA